MSNVLINVVSEFDQKGFKQADRGINALTKQVVKLGATLGLARRAQQAMLDAMADEKATKVLAQNLRNLGMAYATIPAEQFIKQMQTQTGILDDELRPAYAQLARVTGDMARTQEILALAFDVSAGTGQDFQSVVNALSQAYVGNNKGLRSLNIGLTQAELKTKSFAEITALLNKQFAGAGAASLETYAGQMRVLQVAAADASETIGYSLLNSFKTVSGSTSVTELADKINNLAEAMAWLTNKAAVGARALLILGGAAQNPRQALKDFKQLLKDVRAEEARWNQRKMKVWYPEGYQTPEMKKAAAAALKREKDRLSLLKQQTNEKKSQLALDKAVDKANAMLSTAKGVFDLEQISVAAAMQNQSLTANEMKRLEIKQAIFALEKALETNDQARIVAATSLLGGLLRQFSVMQKQEALLGQIQSAFDALGLNRDLINLANLQEALLLIQQMNLLLNGMKTPATKNAITAKAPIGSPYVYSPFSKPYPELVGNAAADAANKMAADAWDIHEKRISTAMNPNYTPTVVVNISDNANKLVDVIMNTVTDQSANGNLPYIIRNGQQLAW